MKRRPIALPILLTGALLLPACSAGADKIASDPSRRKGVIDALIANPESRTEVINRLVGPPNERAMVIERILQDEEVMGTLVVKILEQDRGKALVAAKVAADQPGAMTFIRMLMLTGVMGEAVTQKQANALGLGEAYAFGNQRRTMADMKRMAGVIDEIGKQQEGRYPVCSDWANVQSCLVRQLPTEKTSALRMVDAWGRPYQYKSDREGTLYVLVSYSSDGVYDGLGKVGPTESFDCDIVFSNGDFVQWPGWIRKNEIR